jgi:hypothetical protein
MADITCDACQGMGTTGGSFPGVFGRYERGETCWKCNGSGWMVRARDPQPPTLDVTGTTSGDRLKDIRSGLPSDAEYQARTQWLGGPKNSAQAMALVAKFAVELSKARESGNRGRIRVWKDYYHRAFLAYTDPFGAKREARS